MFKGQDYERIKYLAEQFSINNLEISDLSFQYIMELQ